MKDFLSKNDKISKSQSAKHNLDDIMYLLRKELDIVDLPDRDFLKVCALISEIYAILSDNWKED